LHATAHIKTEFLGKAHIFIFLFGVASRLRRIFFWRRLSTDPKSPDFNSFPASQCYPGIFQRITAYQLIIFVASF